MESFKIVFLYVVALFIIDVTSLKAQEKIKISVNVGFDLVSNYIWRGSPSLGEDNGATQLSPNFQPGLSVGIGSLTVGAWGSYDFLGKYHETDLYVSYAFGPVTTTITDYFWTYPAKYFNYKSEETAHIIEGALTYTGSEKFPINITLASFLYGADKKSWSDTLETDGKKQNFSTYIEVGYSFKLGSSQLNPFIGITPYDGYYGDGYGNVDGFQVVNFGATASKTLMVSEKFSIPVKLSLIYNPVMEKSFLVVGLTL
jgi:hypothetical protein